MKTTQEYVPGVCNIGPAEIRSRRQAGWFALVLTLFIWAGFVYFKIPAPWRILLFFPAAMSAVGFLQAKMHFCAAFGILGVFNFGSKVGKTETIAQKEYRRKDQIKAFLIVMDSSLIGLAVALLGIIINITNQ
jgi:hypothetical protein